MPNLKTTSNLNLRLMPGADIVKTLEKGEIVALKGTYHKVVDSVGNVGYVAAEYTEAVKSDFNTAVFQDDTFIGKPCEVDVDFFPVLSVVASYAKTRGVEVYVTSAIRVLGQDLEGALVKPASKSCHNIGHAIDFNVVLSGKYYGSKQLPKAEHSELPTAVFNFIDDLRNDPAIRWGGDFNTEDPIHLDDNYYNNDPEAYEAKIDARAA